MPRKKKANIDTTETKYTVELVCEDQKHTEDGETVFEALKKLKPNPIKARFILKASKGDKEYQIYVYPARLRKILASDVWKQILDKRFTQQLL